MAETLKCPRCTTDLNVGDGRWYAPDESVTVYECPCGPLAVLEGAHVTWYYPDGGEKALRWALERIIRAHRDEHQPPPLSIGVTPALCCRMAWDAKSALERVEAPTDTDGGEELALLRDFFALAAWAHPGYREPVDTYYAAHPESEVKSDG